MSLTIKWLQEKFTVLEQSEFLRTAAGGGGLEVSSYSRFFNS